MQSPYSGRKCRFQRLEKFVDHRVETIQCASPFIRLAAKMISVSLENSRQCAFNERTEAPVKLTTVCFGCHQTFDGKRMDEPHGERSTSGGTSSAHGDGDEIVQRQAGRVHDAQSLAASNDENLPTGSKAALHYLSGGKQVWNRQPRPTTKVAVVS